MSLRIHISPEITKGAEHRNIYCRLITLELLSRLIEVIKIISDFIALILKSPSPTF